MRRILFSFGFLHSTNTALNVLFNFAQMIVFARVLAPESYSAIVVLTAVGFFLKPMDQAIGRANFIALREGTVRGTHSGQRPEVALFLYGQLVLVALVSAVLPLWIERGAHHYLQDALYLGFALLTNFWALDLQTTAWSVDLPTQFVRISLMQRAIHFGVLALLWFTRSFLLFSTLAVLTMAVFGVFVALMIGARSTVISPLVKWRELTWSAVRAHGRLVWTSLLTTLSELVVLNFTYALISAVFGVGAVVVIFDSIMKIVRLAMTGSRTLAEIALPRHSRMTIEKDLRGSTNLFLLVLAVCVGAAAVPALALTFAGPRIFALLLGPNNVVPPAAGPVAGIIVLISGLYQPVLFFLGFANAAREIRDLTLASLIGFAVFAFVTLAFRLGELELLWAYAVYFGLATLAATALLDRVEHYTRLLPGSRLVRRQAGP